MIDLYTYYPNLTCILSGFFPLLFNYIGLCLQLCSMIQPKSTSSQQQYVNIRIRKLQMGKKKLEAEDKHQLIL